jgi:hypothetical protein
MGAARYRRPVEADSDPTNDELPLAGGMGSGGQVVRIGDTVRRPWRPETPAVHAFLQHLEAVGFDGAPRDLGTDEQGRAILTYIEGDVGVPPFPAWTATDDLLASVADLQRRLHDAARSFTPSPDLPWQRANLPPPSPGSIVCHNDLCVENVVVRDGRAVAFIDFDFAAPTEPAVDIAIMARHWVPVRDPVDLDEGRAAVDQVGRFQLVGDLFELRRSERKELVEACGDFLDRALISMKARADAGQPAYVAAWEAGYPEQNRRSRHWLDANEHRLWR